MSIEDLQMKEMNLLQKHLSNIQTVLGWLLIIKSPSVKSTALQKTALRIITKVISHKKKTTQKACLISEITSISAKGRKIQ